MMVALTVLVLSYFTRSPKPHIADIFLFDLICYLRSLHIYWKDLLSGKSENIPIISPIYNPELNVLNGTE